MNDLSTCSFECIGQPRAVAERLATGSRLIWLLTKRGEYAPVPAYKFRPVLRAHIRRGDRSFAGRSWLQSTKVRCIAGLPPGLYRDGRQEFLNPQFVPVVEPNAPTPPPAEFAELAAKLGELLRTNTCPAEWAPLRARLVEIYKKARGIVGFRPRARGGQGCHERFPCDDHCGVFRGALGYVWTSQPYYIDLAEIVGFARLHGLSVTISQDWSWHYPGKSVLIEWQRDPLLPHPKVVREQSFAAGLLALRQFQARTRLGHRGEPSAGARLARSSSPSESGFAFSLKTFPSTRHRRDNNRNQVATNTKTYARNALDNSPLC